MQISAAIFKPFQQSHGLINQCFVIRLLQLPGPKGPPEPIAIKLFSGSITSPLPEIINEAIGIGNSLAKLKTAHHPISTANLLPVQGRCESGCPDVSPVWLRNAQTE